jgi:transcriptional regulator with XRE-family HTH domain
VPKKWALKRIAEHRKAKDNGDHYAHYLSTADVSDKLGVSENTITRYLRNRKGILKQYLEHVHVVRGYWQHGGKHRPWLFEPYGIAEARKKLEADRAKAKAWVTVKELAVDLDVKLPLMHKRLKGFEVAKLLHKGTLTSFVSPETAALMHEYYGKKQAA